MSKVVLILIVIIAIAAAGYYYMKGNSKMDSQYSTMDYVKESPSPMSDMMMTQTITLDEQNDSNESGTAILTEENGKVKVTLSMTGAPDITPQPAHIHAGSCPNVGAVTYPLTNIVNGKSETVLDVTLADLAAKQPLGINVHKSVPEAKVYVSCGDLNLPMSSAMPMTKDATSQGMMKY